MCHYRLQECTSGDAETPHRMFTKNDIDIQKNLLVHVWTTGELRHKLFCQHVTTGVLVHGANVRRGTLKINNQTLRQMPKQTKKSTTMNRSAAPQSVSSTRDDRSGDVAVWATRTALPIVQECLLSQDKYEVLSSEPSLNSKPGWGEKSSLSSTQQSNAAANAKAK